MLFNFPRVHCVKIVASLAERQVYLSPSFYECGEIRTGGQYAPLTRGTGVAVAHERNIRTSDPELMPGHAPNSSVPSRRSAAGTFVGSSQYLALSRHSLSDPLRSHDTAQKYLWTIIMPLRSTFWTIVDFGAMFTSHRIGESALSVLQGWGTAVLWSSHGVSLVDLIGSLDTPACFLNLISCIPSSHPRLTRHPSTLIGEFPHLK